MKRLLPPVRIHSWGGLGSQLFAIAMAEDFKAIYPNRFLKIVLHTGGVTRRLPEVAELFPEFEYEYKEDFQQKNEFTVESTVISRYFIRNTIKWILSAIGFLAHCDDDVATNKLAPWVLSIRGHYSYRTMNSNFLSRLADRCKKVNVPKIADLNKTCIVHYRLGDLLEISEKTPITAQSIASEFLRIKKKIHFENLLVFSDSPSEARLRFSPLFANEFQVLDSKTSLVIANAIQAKYFIGTSSKVSFWIAGLREVVYKSPSSLPLENLDQFIISSGGNSGLLYPYSTSH